MAFFTTFISAEKVWDSTAFHHLEGNLTTTTGWSHKRGLAREAHVLSVSNFQANTASLGTFPDRPCAYYTDIHDAAHFLH